MSNFFLAVHRDRPLSRIAEVWSPALGIPLYLIGMTALLFGSFSMWAYDDPFIVYRYASNLAGGEGFVYNPGERVLSTTTVLFALLLAGISKLAHVSTQALPLMANLIGSFCLACGGLLLWDLARTWKFPAAGWLSLLLYPTFPSLVGTLGSEMPLYVALCLATLAAYARRKPAWAAAFVGLATLTRPDGLLLAVLLAGHSWLFVKPRPSWKAVAIFAALTLPWVVFAWSYYGSPLPVTLAAKQYQGSMTISRQFFPGLWDIFLGYLRQPYFALQIMLAVPGLGFFAWQNRRHREDQSTAGSFWLLWGWLAAYSLAYGLLGVSRYYWYYAPLIAGWTSAVGLGTAALVSFLARADDARKPWLRPGLWLAAILIIGVLAGQLHALLRQSQKVDRRIPVFQQIGEWLRENTTKQDRIGALEIGAIGYYSRRSVVDFAGLIQPDVAPQLAQANSYEDAAIWAVKRYQPEYIVLNNALFPRLESGYIARMCKVVREFPSGKAEDPATMSVYVCRPKPTGR